jgi:hypothetical protein
VYRHSVVPGGVLSPAEMRQSTQADRIVAAHYADLNIDRMRPVRLVRDAAAHVSFRMHDAIYWTRSKIRLHKGEVLLTDGKNWVRGRCGNRISFRPQRPFLFPVEPPEKEFEISDPDLPPPVLAQGRFETPPLPLLPQTPHSAVPVKQEKRVSQSSEERFTHAEYFGHPVGQLRVVFPPLVPKDDHDPRDDDSDDDHHELPATPEPATILLVCSGLIALVARQVWRARKRS